MGRTFSSAPDFNFYGRKHYQKYECIPIHAFGQWFGWVDRTFEEHDWKIGDKEV